MHEEITPDKESAKFIHMNIAYIHIYPHFANHRIPQNSIILGLKKKLMYFYYFLNCEKKLGRVRIHHP